MLGQMPMIFLIVFDRNYAFSAKGMVRFTGSDGFHYILFHYILNGQSHCHRGFSPLIAGEAEDGAASAASLGALASCRRASR